jgi:hypothetical protein
VQINLYDGKKGFFLWQTILECDAIMLHRPFTSQQANIAQTIKASNRPLIVDWDDDLTALPPWNPNRHHYEKCQPALEAIASLADVVTVTCQPMAEKARQWGAKNVLIIPNAIDDHFKSLPSKPRTKRVVWRGSNTHSSDIETCRPALKEFAEKGYEVCFFGDVPAWAFEVPNYRHFPVSDYCNFLTTMHSAAPEYMVVGLVDHPFNHSKSDIAAQEAYLIGAKLLHNGVGQFAGLPETSEPRWLSDVNHLRANMLRSLCAS